MEGRALALRHRPRRHQPGISAVHLAPDSLDEKHSFFARPGPHRDRSHLRHSLWILGGGRRIDCPATSVGDGSHRLGGDESHPHGVDLRVGRGPRSTSASRLLALSRTRFDGLLFLVRQLYWRHRCVAPGRLSSRAGREDW